MVTIAVLSLDGKKIVFIFSFTRNVSCGYISLHLSEPWLEDHKYRFDFCIYIFKLFFAINFTHKPETVVLSAFFLILMFLMVE